MNTIKIVWFDFGGVLSPSIDYLFDQYAVKTGLSPHVLKNAMKQVAHNMGMPMLAPIESATISEEEWGVRLEASLLGTDPSLDLSQTDLQHFGKQWFNGVVANHFMINTLKRIKLKGLKTGVLTNNVLEWEPYWRSMINLDGVVDYIVNSCHEKCRKPDTSFFNIALQECGLNASDCILIDDVMENIEAAKKLGWHAIHFKNNFETLYELQSIIGIQLIGIPEVYNYE